MNQDDDVSTWQNPQEQTKNLQDILKPQQDAGIVDQGTDGSKVQLSDDHMAAIKADAMANQDMYGWNFDPAVKMDADIYTQVHDSFGDDLSDPESDLTNNIDDKIVDYVDTLDNDPGQKGDFMKTEYPEEGDSPKTTDPTMDFDSSQPQPGVPNGGGEDSLTTVGPAEDFNDPAQGYDSPQSVADQYKQQNPNWMNDNDGNVMDWMQKNEMDPDSVEDVLLAMRGGSRPTDDEDSLDIGRGVPGVDPDAGPEEFSPSNPSPEMAKSYWEDNFDESEKQDMLDTLGWGGSPTQWDKMTPEQQQHITDAVADADDTNGGDLLGNVADQNDEFGTPIDPEANIDPLSGPELTPAEQAQIDDDGTQIGDLNQDEVSDYLDELRESGVTNMFGAGTYLQDEFGLDPQEARDYLKTWMDNFGKPKGQDGTMRGEVPQEQIDATNKKYDDMGTSPAELAEGPDYNPADDEPSEFRNAIDSGIEPEPGGTYNLDNYDPDMSPEYNENARNFIEQNPNFGMQDPDVDSPEYGDNTVQSFYTKEQALQHGGPGGFMPNGEPIQPVIDEETGLWYANNEAWNDAHDGGLRDTHHIQMYASSEDADQGGAEDAVLDEKTGLYMSDNDWQRLHGGGDEDTPYHVVLPDLSTVSGGSPFGPSETTFADNPDIDNQSYKGESLIAKVSEAEDCGCKNTFEKAIETLSK